MKVFVIIPGFNEEKYLKDVLQDVLKITKNVIYVDDGSSDRSVSIAKKYLQHVLVHDINLGKGAAMKTGCDYAFKKLGADAVVFMDSDGQHKSSDLPLFFIRLQKGVQVVFGVRKFSSTMPLIRFLGNKFASILLNILFRKYMPDIPSGFKALTKKAYHKLKWESSGYEVETEIAAKVAKMGILYETVEIQTTYHDVYKGVSLLEALNIMRFLIQLRLRL